ncbi:MAG: hypothetical protein JWN80_3166, partial [Microbacteriaceae bacterium]|nr:hypothetical protein [Microbacteriaceae bacterium]
MDPPADLEKTSGAAEDQMGLAATTATPQISLSELQRSSLAASVEPDDEPTPEEIAELSKVVPSVYHDFLDVFSKSNADTLPPHRGYDLTIDFLEDKIPPFGPIYGLAAPEQKTLKEYIDDMLAKGFIRPSTSPCGAPVLFAKNKGKLQLCVDYRLLNKMTVKNRYPLPLIDTLLAQLSAASIFTKMDLRSAYNLIRVAEGHEWKTAFRTRYGLFEYLVVPFGLSNAPAVFQRYINECLHDLIDVYVIVYLDDILVFSKDIKEHEGHVREVLKRLRAGRLYANASKCEFSIKSCDYLGYLVSPSGITMDPAKVKTVTDWPAPNRVVQLQAFLGFANFYRRFIRNYSLIAKPLTTVAKTGQPLQWGEPQQTAFERLKTAFTTAPVLAHFQPHLPTILETDASDYAIGAILSQRHEDSTIHPVAFASRGLVAAELNYEIHDKELLAIRWSLQHWRAFTMSCQDTIEVLTNHRSLEYFMSTKLLTRRQARWAEHLSEYDFTVVFRPGKQATKPDALSRRDDVYPGGGNASYAAQNQHNNIQLLPNTADQSQTARLYLSNTSIPKKDQLLPDTLILRISEGQQKDPFCIKINEQIKAGDTVEKFTHKDQLLLRDGRIVVPEDEALQLDVVKSRHDHPTRGHPGRTKTLQMVTQSFWWTGVARFVADYVKSCFQCMRTKTQRHKKYGLLHPLPIPVRPWSSISMDFIEPLPKSGDCDSILVVVDRLTKMGLFIPTTTKLKAEGLAELFIRHVFSKHGVPADIVSDRGSKFTSSFWRSLSEALGIEQSLSTAFHPETDGQTERVNQVLEQYLRLYVSYDQSDWVRLLPLAEFAYNNTPHSSTTLSPFFANKGYNPTGEVAIDQITDHNYIVTAEEIATVHEHCKQEIAIVIERYEANANVKRIPFQVIK